MTKSVDDADLGPSERRELEAEVASLRAELAGLRAASTRTDVPGGAERPRRRSGAAMRWVGCLVLVVLASVIVMAAVGARFVRSELLDTDRYVETITPVGADPAVQAEIADQVTDRLVASIDLEGVVGDALAGLAEQAPRLPDAITGLAPVIAGQAESFIHNTVSSFVASEQFEELWVRANRRAHESLVAVVTGETGGFVEADDSGTVSLSLGAVLSAVRDRLTERGLGLAERIPDADAEFVLMQSDDLVRVQRLVRLLDRAATILPWLALLVGLGAVAVAPRGRRRRAVVIIGVGVVVAMTLLALAVNIGRALYLDAVPSDTLSPAAATVVIDAVLVPLRTMIRAVAVVAIVVALAAYLTGTSASARAVRSGVSTGIDRLRAGRSSRPVHPVEAFVAAHRRVLRVGIVAVAAVVLIFWRYPSGAVVAVVSVLAVLVLLLVEFVARTPDDDVVEPAVEPATDPQTGGSRSSAE